MFLGEGETCLEERFKSIFSEELLVDSFLDHLQNPLLHTVHRFLIKFIVFLLYLLLVRSMDIRVLGCTVCSTFVAGEGLLEEGSDLAECLWFLLLVDFEVPWLFI